jgi:hypothetical protein
MRGLSTTVLGGLLELRQKAPVLQSGDCLRVFKSSILLPIGDKLAVGMAQVARLVLITLKILFTSAALRGEK